MPLPALVVLEKEGDKEGHQGGRQPEVDQAPDGKCKTLQQWLLFIRIKTSAPRSDNKRMHVLKDGQQGRSDQFKDLDRFKVLPRIDTFLFLRCILLLQVI